VPYKQTIISKTGGLMPIVLGGVVIATVAGWARFAYGTVPKDIPPMLILAVFLLGLIAILLSALSWLIRRWRKDDRPRPLPGRWAFAWAAFQVACMMALVALGVAGLVAMPFGYGTALFQAFVLVLVSSALVFMVGSAVRELSWAVRSLR
jgi:hypothetical protein